ncbi:uncharacterized protein LOC113461118 [Phoenix dactylifera]|uniref:Uncharacterized protein LOC113461118 n=1 Tax=Phoenix dactylifera TaxID=42345 RepID=A0A8B9AB17_PHODC|nr:uncharacterized protein LOC113461118 [Phoenix dactylifera]
MGKVSNSILNAFTHKRSEVVMAKYSAEYSKKYGDASTSDAPPRDYDLWFDATDVPTHGHVYGFSPLEDLTGIIGQSSSASTSTGQAPELYTHEDLLLTAVLSRRLVTGIAAVTENLATRVFVTNARPLFSPSLFLDLRPIFPNQVLLFLKSSSYLPFPTSFASTTLPPSPSSQAAAAAVGGLACGRRPYPQLPSYFSTSLCGVEKQHVKNVSGNDAFTLLFAAVESDIDTALQKWEMDAGKKNRVTMAAMNAKIQRTKARLMEEVPKLQRLALKKVSFFVILFFLIKYFLKIMILVLVSAF